LPQANFQPLSSYHASCTAGVTDVYHQVWPSVFLFYNGGIIVLVKWVNLF
jgi:hypothetical protein